MRVSYICILCLILSFSSYVQGSTGKIIGKIIDEEGNPIPGVTVTIKDLTITSMTAISDSSGIYQFLSLPPGEYSIRHELGGFKTKIIENIIVQTGEIKYVDIVMEVAVIEEEITVIAESPIVNIRRVEKEDWEIEQLSVGKILFSAPRIMKEDIKERIEVRISQNIKEDLTKGLRGRGLPQVEEILISTVMKVKLSGDTFKIEPLSEEQQVISPSGYTQWEWDVTPLKAGHRIICLSVAVSIYLDKFGERKKSLPVMEKEIYVRVNPKIRIFNFIKNYWYIFVGAIGTLFGIYLGYKQLKLAYEQKKMKKKGK